MDRPLNPRRRSQPTGVPRAAKCTQDTSAGALAEVKLIHGDGTTIRGPWIGRAPMRDDMCVVFEDDDGTCWIASWPA